MPIGAAVPAIISGGASLGAALLGRKSAKGAATPSPIEQQATGQQNEASTALMGQGQQLADYGMPKLQQAGNYFSTLANGNRGATSQLLAPDVENINKTYGGTDRTLRRFLRGPERDVQLGELERERAGSVASLFKEARPNAVNSLVGLGQYGQSGAMSARGSAAGIAGGVGAQGMQGRLSGETIQRQAGSDFGGLLFELLKGLGGNKGTSSAMRPLGTYTKGLIGGA